MAEKTLEKMLLGQLIAELLETHEKINDTYTSTTKTEEPRLKREELKNYEKQIYEELDKREKDYKSHHPEPVYH